VNLKTDICYWGSRVEGMFKRWKLIQNGDKKWSSQR
jgi:hypothetical protein